VEAAAAVVAHAATVVGEAKFPVQVAVMWVRTIPPSAKESEL